MENRFLLELDANHVILTLLKLFFSAIVSVDYLMLLSLLTLPWLCFCNIACVLHLSNRTAFYKYTFSFPISFIECNNLHADLFYAWNIQRLCTYRNGEVVTLILM